MTLNLSKMVDSGQFQGKVFPSSGCGSVKADFESLDLSPRERP